ESLFLPYRKENSPAEQSSLVEMGECKSSGNKQICNSLHELLIECFTNESAHMPTCNRFLMSLPLEQFFSAVLLGIFPIQNLEPSAVLSLCDVGCRFLLGNNALQVMLTNFILHNGA